MIQEAVLKFSKLHNGWSAFDEGLEKSKMELTELNFGCSAVNDLNSAQVTLTDERKPASSEMIQIQI